MITPNDNKGDIVISIQRVKLPELPDAISPYCDAVRVDNLIFISGFTGLPRNPGNVVPSVVEQFEKILSNLEVLLASLNATLKNIVTVTIYVRNMEDRAKIVSIRQKHFGDALPASTIVEVSKLWHENCLIEMSSVAALE